MAKDFEALEDDVERARRFTERRCCEGEMLTLNNE